jgi:hypothetical protein
VPIDPSPKTGDERPLQKLTIAQTLDERQADEGKLILEIKATAQGLVPQLNKILDLAPEGFDVVEIEDEGVSVSRFDPDSDDTVVVSERLWMVTMQAREDLPERPTAFQFGAATIDVDEIVYQRYDDADLLAVEREISLVEEYGETSYAWVWLAGAVLFTGVVLAVVVVRSMRCAPQAVESRFILPQTITPFTVLGLLRQIERNNGFDGDGKLELGGCIKRLEEHYFFRVHDDEPNLREIAELWLQRSS